MSAYIYIEGGGTGADSKESKIRCQEGFHKLLDKCGFIGRKPRLVACGGRSAVHDRFLTAHSTRSATYVAMWIDSEEPMTDMEQTWRHLQNVQSVPTWDRPDEASDDQVLLMNTCMETWFVADRSALKEHFGAELRESGLPALVDLEKRLRQEIYQCLVHATRTCPNAYTKGGRSFQILGHLSPATLERHLPSFVRVRRILSKKL